MRVSSEQFNAPDARASVVFRLDASAHIGSGHLMRCLALAAVLKERGADCAFLLRPSANPWAEQVRAAGHVLYWLPEPDGAMTEPDAPPQADWLGTSQAADARECQALLRDRPRPDWLVVDHYALDARWERALRPAVGRILVIDDLADRPHECDLLLDQNFQDPLLGDRYASLLPSTARSLLGPRYALLRKEFVRQSATDLPDCRRPVRHVLVCFGGVAQQDITLRCVRVLASLPGLTATVIAPQTMHADLQVAAHPGLSLRLLPHTDRMAALMRSCDLAIGAGGGMLWERFSQGLPGLVLGVADNQRPGIAALLQGGLVCGHPDADALDDDDLRALLRGLLRMDELRAGQARRAAALVDGQGAARTARRLLQPSLQFRRASAADAEALFEWRNHPDVRRFSHDDRPLERASHERWFAQVLSNPQRCLLIGQLDGTPVGVARFDLSESSALISVYLAPDHLGSGFGPPLINQACEWLQGQHPEVRQIHAEIQNRNAASLAAFATAGFQPHAQTLIRIQE
ncbi:UDP-2,4-diacetamido-2,4,6-trideoxy-beta-L-altropyranose hydrolase [Ideonella margarita]|uniref:UDP-2,4-diacetamido-2,4, 6-trideoxy-beta-L-altropyranose hydrolase n=1 Tax=Ideonella margarita TaxID=2984191 RepID=A0ABU9BZR0_9BURK